MGFWSIIPIVYFEFYLVFPCFFCGIYYLDFAKYNPKSSYGYFKMVDYCVWGWTSRLFGNYPFLSIFPIFSVDFLAWDDLIELACKNYDEALLRRDFLNAAGEGPLYVILLFLFLVYGESERFYISWLLPYAGRDFLRISFMRF